MPHSGAKLPLMICNIYSWILCTKTASSKWWGMANPTKYYKPSLMFSLWLLMHLFIVQIKEFYCWHNHSHIYCPSIIFTFSVTFPNSAPSPSHSPFLFPLIISLLFLYFASTYDRKHALLLCQTYLLLHCLHSLSFITNSPLPLT